MPAVVVEDLRKSYGSVEALGGISFTIEEGEVFALLGPNGAGKTTTVEILEGHRRRTSGRVSVLGHDPEHGERALRERVGIVLQEGNIDRVLTVGEAVRLFAGFYPAPLAADEILEQVGLTASARTQVRWLSGGQRRRLDLALALVGDPALVFLDEPTTGFDPGARRDAWRMLERLRTRGLTIVLTSHYMDEVQHLADRVMVIAGGLAVAEGPPEMLGRTTAACTEITCELPSPAAAAMLPRSLSDRARVTGTRLTITTDDAVGVVHELTAWALTAGVALSRLEVREPSLEQVYLELTGQAGDEH